MVGKFVYVEGAKKDRFRDESEQKIRLTTENGYFLTVLLCLSSKLMPQLSDCLENSKGISD